MLKPLAVSIAISLGTLALPAHAVQYMVKDLGVSAVWNNGYTPRSINNSGEVLAWVNSPYGAGSDWLVERPAVWNGQTWQVPEIAGRSGPEWQYFGEVMNNHGVVAITTMRTAADYGELVDSEIQSYLWNSRTNTVTVLSNPGPNNGYGNLAAAFAINNNGTVAGAMGFIGDESSYKAMTWNNNTYTDVSNGLIAGNSEVQIINGSGAVAGQIYSSQDDNSVAAFFSNGTTIRHYLMPQGKNDFDMMDMNDQNIVVFNVEGDCSASGCGRVGIIWDPIADNWLTIPSTPGQWGSSANGINNLGQVVGQGMDGDQYANWDSGLLWDPINGIQSLNESLAPGERYWIREGYDINDEGAILAIGAYHGTPMEGRLFILTPVPEPETYALMLAGLGLVGFAARRRKLA
jgi:uncharacterized membrane protein